MTPAAPSLPARLSRAAAAVLPALSAAAARTGVEFGALFNTARLESGFNPSARAATSSATGLFQFIDSTWLSILSAHGARHGIMPDSRAEALALRRNPDIAALMAAELMADNGRRLADRLGREASGLDLYLAHFLGSAGAVRFLSAMAEAPETPAARLFPAAARANRAIFGPAGAPLTLAEVHAKLARRFEGTGGQTVAARAPTMAGASQPNANAGPPTGPPGAAFAGGPDRQPAREAARVAYLLLAELGA